MGPVATSQLLEVCALNAWYGQAHILFDVDLAVRPGEVVALLGRNGAGKSTTLKALMGLVQSTGMVQFSGQPINHLAPFRRARLGLGYVPEDRRIFTDLTVAENLRTGRQPSQRASLRAGPLWDVDMLLQCFPNLSGMLDRRGDQMSGGEQQMLAVARTLMGNPRLVLLDEPSEGVAPVIVDNFVALLHTMKERGVSVVLAEQNLGFAAQVCSRAYVLEKGQIQYAGSMDGLQKDDMLRRRFLTV